MKGDPPRPEPVSPPPPSGRREDEDWRSLLADPSVPAEQLRRLAARPDADPEALEALARDERRLKELPEIAAAIYANRRAPLSTANRAIATCRRAGVVPEGLVGFDELVRAIDADPESLQPGVLDPGFAALLGGIEASSADIDTDTDADTHDDDTASLPRPKTPGARRSATIDFSRLKLYEKIRLATLGNAYCRQNLLRDSNRMVAMAAIRSPQITDGEIAKAAGNRSLSEDVIRYIGNRKELVKQYPIKLALVGNAKCPLTVALRLLPTLHAEDIKHLARSKNVPAALSVAAKRLAAARGPQ